MVHHNRSSQSAGDKLAYDGIVIRKRGSMLILTDMWRAAGGHSARRPSLWLALDETAHFRKFVRIHTVDDTIMPSGLNVGQDDIMDPRQDGLVLAGRGKGGATWAHWQLALAYARYLSPPFHLWCNSVIRTVMEQPGLDSPKGGEALFRFLESRFQLLARRFDTADRHAADLMFLISSTQEILLGKRRDFTDRSQGIMRLVIGKAPYEGRCPCCEEARVLGPMGNRVTGADYDHFFHRGLNRPEHGWLICRSCHFELTQAGCLARFARVGEFRAFQSRVAERRRSAPPQPDAIAS